VEIYVLTKALEELDTPEIII